MTYNNGLLFSSFHYLRTWNLIEILAMYPLWLSWHDLRPRMKNHQENICKTYVMIFFGEFCTLTISLCWFYTAYYGQMFKQKWMNLWVFVFSFIICDVVPALQWTLHVSAYLIDLDEKALQPFSKDHDFESISQPVSI